MPSGIRADEVAAQLLLCHWSYVPAPEVHARFSGKRTREHLQLDRRHRSRRSSHASAQRTGGERGSLITARSYHPGTRRFVIAPARRGELWVARIGSALARLATYLGERTSGSRNSLRVARPAG